MIGVRIRSLHAPFIKDCVLYQKDYINYLKRFEECCRKGCIYNASYIVIHLPVIEGEQLAIETNPSFESLKNSLLLWSKMAEEANHYRLKLAFENLPPNEGWPQGCTWKMTYQIVKMLKKNNIGTCLDISHCFVNKQTSAILTECELADLLLGIHVSDGIWDSKRDCHLPPGEGDFLWNTFFSLLHKFEYNGSLVVEVNTPYSDGHLIKKIFCYLKENSVRR